MISYHFSELFLIIIIICKRKPLSASSSLYYGLVGSIYQQSTTFTPFTSLFLGSILCLLTWEKEKKELCQLTVFLIKILKDYMERWTLLNCLEVELREKNQSSYYRQRKTPVKSKMQVNKNISKISLNMVINLAFVGPQLNLRNAVCQLREKRSNNKEKKEFSNKRPEKQSKIDFNH